MTESDPNQLGVPAKRHTNPDGSIGGWVANTATVAATAWVSGDAQVYGNARVSGDARVYGNAQVSGDARVSGDAWVSGDAQVYGNARVSGDAQVYGNARVSGDARVYGNAQVHGNALVVHARHISTAGPMGSLNGTVTLARTETGHTIFAGCWSGTVDEMVVNVTDRAAEHWGDSPLVSLWTVEFLALAEMFRLRIAEWDSDR